MNKKILLIYTGGTIGMKKTDDVGGYANDESTFKSILAEVKQSLDYDFNIEIKRTSEIIDSSQLNIKMINEVLSIIKSSYLAFDAFLIVNGTDTMAYMQSILKWSIEGLKKPIVLTGTINTSDIDPLEGTNNIKYSLKTLMENDEGFIGIVMEGKLLKNPTTKFNSYIKSPYLEVENSFLEEKRIALLDKSNNLDFILLKEDLEIEFIRVNPLIGINEGEYKDGLILEVYGQGTILDDEKLLNRILGYKRKEKPIIIISQSIKNKLDVNTYSAGNFLVDIGIKASASLPEEAFGCINYLLLKNILFL